MKKITKKRTRRFLVIFMEWYNTFSDLEFPTYAILGIFIVFSVEISSPELVNVFAKQSLAEIEPTLKVVESTALLLVWFFMSMKAIAQVDLLGFYPIIRNAVAALIFLQAISHGFFFRFNVALIVIRYIILFCNFLLERIPIKSNN